MMLLIKLGYTTEKEIFAEVSNVKPAKKAGGKDGKGNSHDTEIRSAASGSTLASRAVSKTSSRRHSETEIVDDSQPLTTREEILENIKKLTKINDKQNFKITEMNSTMVKAIRDTIADIWASVISVKCPHCEAKPPTVKIDSNTKVLMETRNEKEQVGKVVHTKKGLEESESEDSDEETKANADAEKTHGIKNKETKQTFIDPIQVNLSSLL